MISLKQNPLKCVRYGIFTAVGLIHLVLILLLRFSMQPEAAELVTDAMVMKLVDVQEFVPPPPPPKPKEKMKVAQQPKASESIVEVEEDVIEKEDAAPDDSEPEYLPQHKISQIPIIPKDEILRRVEYPPLALRQGIEAVVFVELFIDQYGNVRNISILRDPGNGFAEAAIKALKGIKCAPAKSNGKTVAVRYRYPIRFTLN